MPNRKKEIPKDGGEKVRVLGIPSIRDRVVQGALLLTLEPIFEADFQAGSFGYRPGGTAHEAVDRVALAIERGKTRVIDIDLRAYFDDVRHHILLTKLAQRIKDRDVMLVLKLILKATASAGRGGVGGGSTRTWGCSQRTGCSAGHGRKRSQLDTPHNPRGEACRRAVCGKSARTVRPGGDRRRAYGAG